MRISRILTLLLSAGSSSADKENDDGWYSEELTLQPLSRNEVLSVFDFQIQQRSEQNREWGLQEYRTFPRSLGQIIGQSHTKELHLRFGQGWWDAERWGSPPSMGGRAGGIGVEVWAWVEGSTKEEAWKNWRRLVHSLGGYFCASINFIDESQTTFPSEQVLSSQGADLTGTWLMRGSLPAEPICTENLTPFLKLLPCQGKAGVASLLDGHTLFRSLWQTMSVDVWRPDSDTLALHQSVASVIDSDLCKEDPLPWYIDSEKLLCDESKPWANDWTCFPVNPKSASYDLKQLFGTEISGHCQLAKSSAVKVVAPSNWLVDGSAEKRELLLDGSHPETPLNLQISTDNAAHVAPQQNPVIYVDRSFSGWGQQNGGIRTMFTNNENYPVTVSYLESLPWFMRLYLHTMQVEGDGAVLDTQYTPSKDRKRPNQVDFKIQLDAGAKFEIEYSFDKSLLYLEEYPPDANHGFEVPPGLAIVHDEHQRPRYEIRTTSLLLSLPVPDFSMPYNVIILTSTVIALAFGTLYNLLVREVVLVKQ